MRPLDRAILVVLALGIWALVGVEALRPAVATTQIAELPMQATFNEYLATALEKAKSVANSCRVKGEIHGSEVDARVNC
jgi:hypothetical protein